MQKVFNTIAAMVIAILAFLAHKQHERLEWLDSSDRLQSQDISRIMNAEGYYVLTAELKSLRRDVSAQDLRIADVNEGLQGLLHPGETKQPERLSWGCPGGCCPYPSPLPNETEAQKAVERHPVVEKLKVGMTLTECFDLLHSPVDMEAKVGGGRRVVWFMAGTGAVFADFSDQEKATSIRCAFARKE